MNLGKINFKTDTNATQAIEYGQSIKQHVETITTYLDCHDQLTLPLYKSISTHTIGIRKWHSYITDKIKYTPGIGSGIKTLVMYQIRTSYIEGLIGIFFFKYIFRFYQQLSYFTYLIYPIQYEKITSIGAKNNKINSVIINGFKDLAVFQFVLCKE